MQDTKEIHKSRLGELRKKLEKLNRKALKLNCREIVLTVSDNEKIMHELHSDLIISNDDLIARNIPTYKIKRTWVLVEATLDYEIPIINGWELISTFDIYPNPETGENVVFTSTVPEKVVPAEFLNKHEIHCDHCGHNRFRTHSMLMRNTETGEYKEVGSTCIKDFFGHNPKDLLWMAQFSFSGLINELEDGFGEKGTGYVYDIKQILEFTALTIRLNGWVSRGAAYEDPSLNATADLIWYYINPPSSLADHEKEKPTDTDIETAANTLKHFTDIDPGDNDYLTNCKKVTAIGYVPMKMMGVTCSMIATYRNFVRRELESKNTLKSEWVGNVKDKLVIENVKCIFLKECFSDWGTSVLYTWLDEKTGNKFKTFYSGSKWECEQDGVYTVKGTVKKHDEFRGSKDTVLTRCSVS